MYVKDRVVLDFVVLVVVLAACGRKELAKVTRGAGEGESLFKRACMMR